VLGQSGNDLAFLSLILSSVYRICSISYYSVSESERTNIGYFSTVDILHIQLVAVVCTMGTEDEKTRTRHIVSRGCWHS
jgi:hypothetical protein